MKSLNDFLNEVKVYDIPDLTKIRMGSKNDGGYIVSEELSKKTRYIYSFGIGNDISFEKDFFIRFPQVKRIHLFDPNVDFNPTGIFTFEKKRFNQVFSKWTMMGVAPNSLLKIDIEWDEWNGVQNMELSSILQFSQLVIEFHILCVSPTETHSVYFQKLYRDMADEVNDSLFDKYFQVMKELNKHFYCFHIHANNSLPKIELYGKTFPPLIELSFVKRNMAGDPVLTTTEFPILGLDYPNKIDRPDIKNPYPLGE